MQKCRVKTRSETGATEIAQFPLTIYCLFLVVLLPVLNLVTLLIAGCTAYLATNDFAAKAATQPSFAQALNAMAVEAYSFQTNSLAQFVKMAPQGGYTGCGNDLYVLATNIGSSGIQSSAPDQSLTSTVDTTKNIYEMQVVSSYSISPLISMASLPLLGSVPGLGQPVTVSFVASRPIEHPGGMQTATNGGNSASVTSFDRIAAGGPGLPPPPTSTSWRNPNIYTDIKNAGETIVNQNVFIVQANNPNLTSSGITVAPGQKIWIDTQAIGTWSGDTNISPPNYTDANGVTAAPVPNPLYYAPNFAPCSLIGIMSSTNSPFLVGNTLTNYSPAGSGTLTMYFNQEAGASITCTGAQMVRVLLVQ